MLFLNICVFVRQKFVDFKRVIELYFLELNSSLVAVTLLHSFNPVQRKVIFLSCVTVCPAVNSGENRIISGSQTQDCSQRKARTELFPECQ